MSSPQEGAVHFPPKYDLQDRRQLWFVEGTRVDDFVNGLLTALLVFAPLLAAGGVL